MQIQWKVTLVVLLTLVGTVSAVIWKTQGLLLEDKTAFLNDSAIKQIAPMKRLVQERLDGEKEKLIRFAGSRATTGSARARLFGDFEVISLVQAGVGGQWTPAWVEKGTLSKPERWPNGHELTLLKSLPYARVKDGEETWVRVSDAQGSPLFAFMVSVEIQSNVTPTEAADAAQLPEGAEPNELAPAGSGKKAIIVGFLANNPLATVSEDFIGALNTVYVVDDRGYVASHVNKGYLGALFTEDSMVKDIIKSQKSSATGRFDDIESHAVIGHFERIDRTNLYAIVSTPMTAATGIADEHLRLAVATGFGVGIFGLIIAWLVGRGIGQPLQSAITALEAINRGDTTASVMPSQANDEIGRLTRLLADSSPTALASKLAMMSEGAKQPHGSGGSGEKSLPEATSTGVTGAPSVDRLAQERRKAFESFSDGFVASLREPLLAIIGHSQLAKGKAPESDPRAHIESIEREARRAKEILERMRGLTEEEAGPPESQDFNLVEVVQRVLEKLKPDFDVEGIELVADLNPVPGLHANRVDIENAIYQVIENAREAMRSRPTRKLKVQTEFLGDQVFLMINDSGTGMSRDVRDRAFEPFFKKFESPKRLGLGLSFVQTTLKRSGGHSELESTPGEGATFTFKFPVTFEEKKQFQSPGSRKTSGEVVKQFSTDQLLTTDSITIPPAAEPQPPPVEAAPMSAPPETPMTSPPPLTETDPPEITLGGRRALDEFTAVNLPPAPPIEEMNDPMFHPDVSNPKIEHPAGASVASNSSVTVPASAGFDDDDDDDESDSFANITLSRSGISLASSSATDVSAAPNPAPQAMTEPSSTPDTAAMGARTKTGFQVKIRRPKSK
jgi:signal transduction histidine kinase